MLFSRYVIRIALQFQVQLTYSREGHSNNINHSGLDGARRSRSCWVTPRTRSGTLTSRDSALPTESPQTDIRTDPGCHFESCCALPHCSDDGEREVGNALDAGSRPELRRGIGIHKSRSLSRDRRHIHSRSANARAGGRKRCGWSEALAAAATLKLRRLVSLGSQLGARTHRLRFSVAHVDVSRPPRPSPSPPVSPPLAWSSASVRLSRGGGRRAVAAGGGRENARSRRAAKDAQLALHELLRAPRSPHSAAPTSAP